MPACQVGWNGLPEDVFHVILKEHLDADTQAAKTLSRTCKTYATFSRPFIFGTISIAHSQKLEEFMQLLIDSPWVTKLVETLRITAANSATSLQTKNAEGCFEPTSTGANLSFVLRWKYPQLKKLELPLLHGNHEWGSLSLSLKHAVWSLLDDHALEEVSITSHYPVELLRLCPTIRSLELRIYPYACLDLPHLMGEACEGLPLPSPIQELAIVDPCSLTLNLVSRLTNSESYINLSELQCLTYYGDKSPTAQLQPLLDHCAGTISSLKVFVGGDGEYCH